MDSDSSSHSNDEDIIQKFRANGDLSLFKVLVQRHQARVYATAYRVLGNSDEAEEVVQDTFIKVHQNLDKFKASASFSSWLFRIAHNVSMDVLRSKQRRRESNLVAFDPQAAPEDDLRTNPGGPVSQLADYRPDPSQMLDQGAEPGNTGLPQQLARATKARPGHARSRGSFLSRHCRYQPYQYRHREIPFALWPPQAQGAFSTIFSLRPVPQRQQRLTSQDQPSIAGYSHADRPMPPLYRRDRCLF